MFGIVLISLANVQGALTDDIISYYKFDEQDTTGSGTIIDATGTNDGTNAGADNSSGLINTAYNFVGANTDYIGVLDSGSLSFSPGTDSYSFQSWFYLGEGTTRVIVSDTFTTYDDGAYILRIKDDDTLNLYGYDLGGVLSSFAINPAGTISTGQWYHVAFTVNTTKARLYLNGTLVGEDDVVAFTISKDDGTVFGSHYGGSGLATYFNGKIDEPAFWGRALTDGGVAVGEVAGGEIAEIWNNGDGKDLLGGVTQITLNSPANETATSNTSLTLEATYNITGTTTNWTNVTYEIWYSNGSVWNNTHNVEITYQNNFTSELFANFSIGEYLWNVKAYFDNATGSFIQRAEENYTFTVAGAFSDFIFDSPVVETSSQTFHVFLEIPEGTTIRAGSGKLNYNGTDYASITATDLGSNQFNLSRTIYIPAGTSGFNWENRSFFWNITVVDTTSGDTFTQTSDSYNQNVTELKFGLCSASLTIPMLNFTLYDENLGTVINATANAVTFQTTFKIDWDFMNKTVAINNLSVAVSEFDFCTNSPTNIFYTSAELFYNAVGFTEKNYYLTNATLTNTTNEINLYLLNEMFQLNKI